MVIPLDGPMRSYVWKGYFEDVEYDHENRNRVQITPMEMARYLIQYPEYDPFYKENVTSLIHYCNASFEHKTPGAITLNANSTFA